MASSVATMPPAADAGPFSRRQKRHHPNDHNTLPAPSSRRDHSHIVDRWAREMIVTIERVAHEAELTDLRPNARASSLIQMWRVKEAEGGAPPATMTTTRGGGGDEGKMARQHPVCLEKRGLVRVRCRREMEDLVERMRKEREREVAALAEMERVSKFSHRGRIQSMLKLRFLRKDLAIESQARPASRKKSPKQPESGVAILFLRERFDNRSHNVTGIPVMERSSTINVHFPVDSQDLCCSTHSDDQFSINNNQYQEVISIEDESLPPCSTSPHSSSEDLHDGSQSAELSTLPSRIDELNEASQGHDFNSLDSISKDLHERRQSPELNLPQFRSGDLLEESHSPELNSLHSGSEYLQEGRQSPELNLLQFISEDLHDGSQSPETSWDERNLWVGNLDWQRTVESQNVHGWQSKSVVPEEVEPFTQQDIINTGHTWMVDSYIPWRGWGANSKEYYDYFETFSDNVEIRELLKRRMVTTLLDSDFRDKMNRIIMAFLQIRGEQHVNENFSEDYGEQSTWRHNYKFNNADQVTSGFSLVPSSYQTVHYPDNWQHSLFSHHSSHNSQELESVHNLKREMAQMHQEISELRKLVESCMGWQAKLQYSIKDEVSSAICQSILVAKTSEDSKRTPGQKNSCCICHEMQVDSLLYRCGHMCTCFKCAHELQRNSGICPICQASIIDVVRAYPNT